MAKLRLFSKTERSPYSHFLLNISHSILPSCSIHSQHLQLPFSLGKTLLYSKGDTVLLHKLQKLAFTAPTALQSESSYLRGNGQKVL